MTVRRVEWNGLPPEYLAWSDWLTGYGIDPRDVAIPGWLEVDDEDRQIRFLAILRDENEGDCFDPNTGRIVTVPCVVQLEAPALPFPDAL